MYSTKYQEVIEIKLLKKGWKNLKKTGQVIMDYDEKLVNNMIGKKGKKNIKLNPESYDIKR